MRGEPEDTIYTLIERWREGDVEGYLNCFAGPARGRLEATAKEMGREEFSNFLFETSRRVLGVAVERLHLSEGVARLRVEFVFKEGNEVQLVALRKIRGRWLIVEMGPKKYRRMPFPYGTKVTVP